MKVEFWGAAQTVTGSMHLVHYKGKRILLDCGMYQGKRKEAFTRNRELPFDAKQIDIVILSHAHIDHSGNLPSLIKAGYKGPIYSTSATRDLCSVLLLDSAKIQESDIKYVNKKRIREKQTPFEPLYEVDDAIKTMRRFRTVEFYDRFSPMPGLAVQFHVAGHMLGAATVDLLFDNEDDSTGKTRLVFSGDIGRPSVPILQDPVTVSGADYVIMEATYGNRFHETKKDSTEILLESIREVHKTGGRLIIPAFSVGRTQELVFRLSALEDQGLLPNIKFFVDSPLAVDATEIYRSHADCFDEEMRNAMLNEKDRNPLGFKALRYIRKAEESIALNQLKEPCVIISASGMCEGGRVLHHLKNSIGKPNTIIMFAGYQAPDTLGRILLDQTKTEVKIYGEPYKTRAQIRKLEGCSGHSDQGELLNWAKDTAKKGNLKQVALVHCELEPATNFKGELQKAGMRDVIIPARGDIMEMGPR